VIRYYSITILSELRYLQGINELVIIVKGIEKPHFFEKAIYSSIEFGACPFPKKIALIVTLCY